MRLLVQHASRYEFGAPAALGPHLIRLRPATHTKAKIESYGLHVSAGDLRWQQDPYGNYVGRLTFKAGELVETLDVRVELAVDVRPVNPFDFFIDDRCKTVPFDYPPELKRELAPFLEQAATGRRTEEFLAGLPRGGPTVPFIVEMNSLVNRQVAYVIREESGIWTPEETLTQGRGSCRDSAVLLIAALRSRGLAARFVSGYLTQLTDEGMIPDQPRGVGRDVVDLHAWAEVYLPGGGWIGLDATSGLLTGEGHIPLACTAEAPLAAPIEGTSDRPAHTVSFSMTVGRLGHEARPTTPYTEDVWRELEAAGDLTDARLRDLGIVLTMGGEPTFNAREHTDAPEWNGEALGATKWTLGQRLASELRARLCPGAATIMRMGKVYPGETLPRWALELCARPDGKPIWSESAPVAGATDADAERLAVRLAAALGVEGCAQPAYEDPWRFLMDEASLPVDVDPLASNLDDPEERRRLARVLGQGLGKAVGWVLPLARAGGSWASEKWAFRRGHLFLIPGDSPVGLRLPLRSLSGAPPVILPVEETFEPPDPRRGPEQAHLPARPSGAPAAAVRTALCVEAARGAVRVFLPPLERVEDFFTLIAAIDDARLALRIPVELEGYAPSSGPGLKKIVVTPDPGVLEVNLPVTTTARDHARLIETVFDAALHSGLHAEKYLLDGRMAGSGGGNHLTLGGTTPLLSPFVRRPDLLASLITFVQHHPSLSYLFTGLFVGPTSQAPRVDEARHDSLYELEIALARAHATRHEAQPAPWFTDMLLRHLLVDVAGNTHRTELCIDKLFDPQTAHGRQGIVELRAFEMPPHPRMATAQMLLVRALVTAFAAEPYGAPEPRLVRWGQGLHDRFLLPHFLWRDLVDVLGYLRAQGLALPEDGYRAFLDLRCPAVGTLQAGDVTVEVRNAMEPWHVLGEEAGASGTSRYVELSMERIEVRVNGAVPERHAILVNGQRLPMHATGTASELIAGVRFRAWAPPHSLQPHIGIHHPIRIDVIDSWAQRSLAACAYHVWHPEGRGYDTPPLTRFEAAARRAQRFTMESPLSWPVRARPVTRHEDAPYTLDLRRLPIDHPVPTPESA